MEVGPNIRSAPDKRQHAFTSVRARGRVASQSRAGMVEILRTVAAPSTSFYICSSHLADPGLQPFAMSERYPVVPVASVATSKPDPNLVVAAGDHRRTTLCRARSYGELFTRR